MLLSRFYDVQVASQAVCVVIDPDVKSTRAIRAYELAGFTQVSVAQTDDGPVALMHFQHNLQT